MTTKLDTIIMQEHTNSALSTRYLLAVFLLRPFVCVESAAASLALVVALAIEAFV